MFLYINTTLGHDIEIIIKDKDKIIARKKITAIFKQAEKLLPMIDGLFRQRGLTIKNLERIIVTNQGNSFTSLRIGVITANALGYALGVPVEGIISVGQKLKKIRKNYERFDIVKPVYHKEPNITVKKKAIINKTVD
jgi:tRNA A37 threonylcarbamoyladenosine modification protein TsaB